MTDASPLAAAFAGNFQAAWYYTIIGLFMLTITCWGIYQVVRTLKAMLREGDILLFATCVSIVVVVGLFFASLVAMALISLGPPIGGGA